MEISLEVNTPTNEQYWLLKSPMDALSKDAHRQDKQYLSSHTPDNSDMLLYKALTAKWAFFSQACNTTDQRAQPALPNAYSLSILY